MADAAKAQEANSGEASTTAQTAAQEAAGTQQQQPQTDPSAEFDALPEWAKKTIKDLRKEQQQRRKQAEEAEAAARQAEERRLEGERQFETLAQQRQARITELEPIATRYDALNAAVLAQAEAEIKQWPAEVQALRPAGSEAAGLLEWMQTARPLAIKLQQASTPPAPGQGQPPKPAGQAAADQAKARAQFERMIRNF